MMRPSQKLYSRGFLGRSVDEIKRLSASVWKLDPVKGPSGPRQLYDFSTSGDINNCILMVDDRIGGSSRSSLEHVIPPPAPETTDRRTETPSSSTTGYARFSGDISTSLPSDRPKIQRTGYAGFRTADQRPTAFGRAFWDIDPYTYLALRIKSDGRSYFVNLQTESVEVTDLHQHRLFAKYPGCWETVYIRWNDFVRTNHGFVTEPQTELLRQKVKTLGIGLTDRLEGPFELCIKDAWATNVMVDYSPLDHQAQNNHSQSRSDVSGFTTRRGVRVTW